MIRPTPDQPPDEAFLDTVPKHHFAYVMSADPLVIMTLWSTDVPAGAAVAYAPDLLKGRRALHLMHPSWTLEEGKPEIMAEQIARMRQQLPLSEFLVLCASEQEVLDCAAVGVPGILGNGLIFTDERVWRPVAPSGTQRFDAVYNGRLDKFKRHHLAKEVQSLLLLYNWALDATQDDSMDRVRGLLPQAVFANHANGAGAYKSFASTEVNAMLAQAHVGLCLSAVEGCMRASMEYLLAGLPIVSTQSVGGRERYFGTAYTRVVAPTPDAVAAAVVDLRNQYFDRDAIRAHVSQILAFERHNLLLTVNRLIRKSFSTRSDVLQSFEPFLGTCSTGVPVRNWRTELQLATSG